MEKAPYIKQQLHELLYQSLESEIGGIRIYQTALSCAQNESLKDEWEEYLEQTRTHERVLLQVFEKLDLNPDTFTPGREVVAHIGASLVSAMEMAKEKSGAAAAQLVAGACVVLAETKEHQHWDLIGHLARHGQGEETAALSTAFESVPRKEDDHLYHTKRFMHELWVESLGLEAVLPRADQAKPCAFRVGFAQA